MGIGKGRLIGFLDRLTSPPVTREEGKDRGSEEGKEGLMEGREPRRGG